MNPDSPYPCPSGRQTALDFLTGNQRVGTIISAFLSACISKRLSPFTVKFYRGHLLAFERYASTQAATTIEQVDSGLLRAYLSRLGESHNAGGVHGHFRVLRALFLWVEREELLPPTWRNPVRKVSGPRLPEHVLEPISLDAVDALLTTCKGQGLFGWRDRAIFLLLLDTGLRARELCNLDLTDVEMSTGEVTVRRGKGGKTRTTYVSPSTLRALRAYLRQRSDQESSALFISRSHQRLTYVGLREILLRRAKQAGLDKGRRPALHDFRRAFAINMLRNGSDIFALQRLMGHSDLQVLKRYLALSGQDLSSTHARCSPVEHHSWS